MGGLRGWREEGGREGGRDGVCNVPWHSQSHGVLDRHELRRDAEDGRRDDEHYDGPDVELGVGPIVFLADYNRRADDCARHCVCCL